VIALPVACVLALCAGSAIAQDGGVARANRLAYDMAMKCFVANGHALGLRKRAGDEAGASQSEVKARQSFDAAQRLGQIIGYSDDRVRQDFGLAQTRELPPMVTDQKYFLKAVAMCKAVGLM
jgi:hypothetical protein